MSDDARQIGTTSLEIVRQLPGPIERVWDHLVLGELRQKWFCGGATAEHEGGEIRMEFDHSRLSPQSTPKGHEGGDQLTTFGQVLRYDKPHVLAFTWDDSDGKDHSQVTIKLREKDGGVELHLLHERLDARSTRVGVSAGWHAHLDLLVDLLAEQSVRDFWDHYLALEKHYDQVLP